MHNALLYWWYPLGLKASGRAASIHFVIVFYTLHLWKTYTNYYKNFGLNFKVIRRKKNSIRTNLVAGRAGVPWKKKPDRKKPVYKAGFIQNKSKYCACFATTKKKLNELSSAYLLFAFANYSSFIIFFLLVAKHSHSLKDSVNTSCSK